MTARDIIIKPIITEKSMAGVATEKKYTFKVDKKATKIQIAKAVAGDYKHTFGFGVLDSPQYYAAAKAFVPCDHIDHFAVSSGKNGAVTLLGDRKDHGIDESVAVFYSPCDLVVVYITDACISCCKDRAV